MPTRKVKKFISPLRQQGVVATGKEVSAFVQCSYSNYLENGFHRQAGCSGTHAARESHAIPRIFRAEE